LHRRQPGFASKNGERGYSMPTNSLMYCSRSWAAGNSLFF
jgi:hypothetical protein